MKKILLLSLLLGLSGCGDNNQSDTSQSNSQAQALQQAEATPTVANSSLAASPRAMSVVAPLQGWSVTNSIVMGASTLIDAFKDTKVSAALVTPNARQVAEVLRGGAAGVALSIAVDQLLGAVDWVLDPANNQIKFKEIVKDNPQFVFVVDYRDNPKFGYVTKEAACNAAVYTKAQALSHNNYLYFPTLRYFMKDEQGNHRCVGTAYNTFTGVAYPGDYYVNIYEVPFPDFVPPVEKNLPLEVVAEKIISNADAGSLDAQVATNIAVSNILNDAEQAERVVQELENNANDRCAAHNSYQNGKASLIEGRYNEMYVDVHNLYRDYRALRPTHPDGWGTWQGHINKYKEEQTLLNAIIVDAILDGCPETVRANRWKKKENPPKPGVHSPG